jgi:hypothetical protein
MHIDATLHIDATSVFLFMHLHACIILNIYLGHIKDNDLVGLTYLRNLHIVIFLSYCTVLTISGSFVHIFELCCNY